MRGRRGSYILVCEMSKEIEVKIGSLGTHRLRRGKYIYVGSALGPGGIRSRVCRHLSKRKKTWWHIDYLTTLPECRIVSIIIIPYAMKRLECIISEKLIEMGFKAPVYKFGSMDCDCISHFFEMKTDSLKELVRALIDINVPYQIIKGEELDRFCSK